VHASISIADTSCSRVFAFAFISKCPHFRFCLPPTSWHRRSKSVLSAQFALLRYTSHETGHTAGNRSDISPSCISPVEGHSVVSQGPMRIPFQQPRDGAEESRNTAKRRVWRQSKRTLLTCSIVSNMTMIGAHFAEFGFKSRRENDLRASAGVVMCFTYISP
jgi:hypothetical protein